MLKANINWIKKNAKSDLKIWKDLISEVDWKDFAGKMKHKAQLDRERIADEVKSFAALPPKEKWDRVINGERQLGRLYQKGAIAFTRREWKGVESTARDFYGWLIIWRDMLKMVMRDPMSILSASSSTAGSAPTLPARPSLTAITLASAAGR